MVQLRYVTLLLLASVVSAQAGAGALRYVASEHQSTWTAESSRLYCSLTHEIPYYGTAVFERRAGGELDFHIQVHRKPRSVGVARLVSSVPAWKHGGVERDLGKMDYTVASKPFRTGAVVARRLLLELERGMFPTLTYKDWSDGRDDIQVALSAVNVRSALGEFLRCLDAQIGYTLDDVRTSRIQFAFNSSELTATARKRLDQIGEYLLADPEVRLVTLKGYTDSIGLRRYNQELARRRANAVRDYLIGMGVSRETIRISAIGERYRLASNRTAQGRAANRVVVVTLTK